MTRLLLLIACLLLVVEARAQEVLQAASAEIDAASRTVAATEPEAPPAGGTTVFRGGVDLVGLNVVVTDRLQRFVGGLGEGSFAVFEDGVRQDVSFFAASRLPIDLAFLLDTSASMSGKMLAVQQAAVGFARSLSPGDRGMVVDVKDSTRILQPLTDNVNSVYAAISSTTPSGGTALYNAVYLTLKELVRMRGADGAMRRQAIVVLSDGDDTASVVAFDDVMELAKQSGVAVYTISLRADRLHLDVGARRDGFSKSDFTMRSLAQETGARAFFPAAVGELVNVYSSIAEELANQYALGYTPKNVHRDGAYRRVSVQVVDPPGVRTRTRTGYTAPRAVRGAAR